MNYNELAKRIHENAVKHGFWDKEYSIEHYLMLVITEIGEMVQADRKGARTHMDGETKERLENSKGIFEKFFRIRVKDSLEDKYADVVIRLLDLAGKYEIEIDESRVIAWSFEKHHFTNTAFFLCRTITSFSDFKDKINYAIAFLREWAKSLNIDLEWHIEQKMRYNETRPVRHGKRY